MATRGHADEVAREAARSTISIVVGGLATGIIEVGEYTTAVAPLCAALLRAKGIVDKIKRNKEELEELRVQCEMITVHVINKAKASRGAICLLGPLKECVDELEKVANNYDKQGCCSRLIHFRRHGADMEKLRGKIDRVIPIMQLSAMVGLGGENANIRDQIEELRQTMARLQPRFVLETMPAGRGNGVDVHSSSHRNDIPGNTSIWQSNVAPGNTSRWQSNGAPGNTSRWQSNVAPGNTTVWPVPQFDPWVGEL